MKLLHITADDLGICRSVNQAIATAATGLVTDTAVLINTPLIEETAAIVSTMHQTSPGLHLTLTWGTPITPPDGVPSLVDSRGSFFSLPSFLVRYFSHRINPYEVEHEWAAQCERFISHIGPIRSLSSHQHLHLLPRLLPIAQTLARNYRVPWLRPHHELHHPGRNCLPRALKARDKLSLENAKSETLTLVSKLSPPTSTPGFIRFRKLPGRSHLESLRLLLLRLPPGRWELVCHPCNPDPDYPAAHQHLSETACLTDHSIQRLCQRLRITIATCGGQVISREVSID